MINAVCRVREITADKAWQMSIADLFLSIKPANEDNVAKDRHTQYVMCLEYDQIAEIRKNMTTQDKIELAEWIDLSCN